MGELHHLFLLYILLLLFAPILFGALFLGNAAYSAVTGNVGPSLWWFGGLFLAFLVKYFYPMLRLKPLNKFLTFCRIRYVSNWALMNGGFKGAKTFGVIYLESSW